MAKEIVLGVILLLMMLVGSYERADSISKLNDDS